MSNIFDSTEWPEYPPDPVIAGDYFAFKKRIDETFPQASYSVTFEASLFGSGTGTTSSAQISLDSVESGSEYQITAGSDVTKDWSVGKYSQNLFVKDSSDGQKRHRLDYGTFEVFENWTSSTVDPRSDAQKNLELIKDIFYNRVQGDVSSYSVAGRSLSKMTPEELIRLRDFFKRQVVMAERKQRIRLKKGTRANILADFRS